MLGSNGAPKDSCKAPEVALPVSNRGDSETYIDLISLGGVEEEESSDEDTSVDEFDVSPADQAVVIARATEFFEGSRMTAEVWDRKYRLRDNDGKPLEYHPVQSRIRMASAVGAEPGSTMYHHLLFGRIVPSGRIQFGLGNHNFKATLKNCYVLGLNDDSLESIVGLRADMARTYAFGGGVGIDLSRLRPKGAPVNNCAITSSGAASFADGYSHLTNEIGQNGRRGALMITLSVDHPDIEEFIHLKEDVDPDLFAFIRERIPKDKFRQLSSYIDQRRVCAFANLSPRITDRFMKAVVDDAPHYTEFTTHRGRKIARTFRARDLFRKICQGAWAHGCPGMMFWDRITQESNFTTLPPRWHCITTNPCGEQPLPDGGSCNLGAVNLIRLVTNPYTDRAAFDWDLCRSAVRDGIIFLDRINTIELDERRSPLPKQAEATEQIRQVALGVMGLGELYLMLGLKYGSEQALEFTRKLFAFIRDEAYITSVELAKQFGPFPQFTWDRYRHSPFIQRLPAKIRRDIRKFGLRNGTLLTVAPTGSTAMVGCTTGGIEPEFSFGISRTVLMGDGVKRVFTIIPWSYRRFMKATRGVDLPEQTNNRVDLAGLPSHFISAHDVEPEARVRTQAIIQQFIDTSISSTVNLPQKATVEDVERIYIMAWEQGCKGITVFREGSRAGILETLMDEHDHLDFPLEVPEVAQGGPRVTFKIDEHRILINTCQINNYPVEVSVTHGKAGAEVHAYSTALGIIVSKALQHGIPVNSIVRSLRGIRSSWHRYLRFGEGEKPVAVRSVPDALAAVLDRFFCSKKPLGFTLTEDQETIVQTCHQCNERTLISRSGCQECINPACGFSACD